MNDLYILTKQEFTSLYRFGKIPLNQNKVIEIDSNSKEEADKRVLEVFSSLPYFVGDEEYLIISFDKKLIDKIWLEIKNVSEIIPLTKAAKNSYQMKFDSRLDFRPPRFENVVREVEEKIDIQEMLRGAEVYCTLCNVNKEYKDKLPGKVIKNAYLKRVNGIKSAEFEDDFFIHLLVYERYDFFPKTDMGFFYDVGEIFAHSKGKPTFKNSELYNYLERNKDTFAEKSLLEFSGIISNSPDIIKFTDQLTEGGLRKFIVAAIFLKIRADLLERDTIKDSESSILISNFRENENYTEELNFAIYITGAFFGYKKFYDDLYDMAGLKIFKNKPEPKQPDIKKESEIEIEIEIEKVNIKIEVDKTGEVSKEKSVTLQRITDEKSQEPLELVVKSNNTNKEDFKEKQGNKKEDKEDNLQNLILNFVRKKRYCKIKPDIIEFVKNKTGKTWNVGNIRSVITADLSDKLELIRIEGAEGVQWKEKGLFS